MDEIEASEPGLADEPERARNSYDVVPYRSRAQTDTYPDHLASVARLFGVEAPDPATARVLEIGCAGGGNLLPMAVAMPDASFVGIDLSTLQIEEAERGARALGLSNTTFLARDIALVGDELGRFDYVICHGVFSWVPERVRTAILSLTERVLNPGGLVYLSLNVLPGWYLPETIRQMMIFHASKAPVDQRLWQAQQMLKAIRGLLTDQTYHVLLREEIDFVLEEEDFYVHHEFLEDTNEPMYFFEFTEKARTHGLRFLSDTRPNKMAAVAPPDFRGVLEALGDSVERREQYLDFVLNRRFRRCLLCRSDVNVSSEPVVEALTTLRLSARVVPGPPRSETFQMLGGRQVAISEPHGRAALRVLIEALPKSLPFPELLAEVQARLGTESPSEEDFRMWVLRAVISGLVDIHQFEPALAGSVSDRPEGSPVARRLAELGPMVANLRHRLVQLVELDRLVLTLLDGQNDRSTIREAVEPAVLSGETALLDSKSQRLTDSEMIREALPSAIETSLRRLLRAALLRG